MATTHCFVRLRLLNQMLLVFRFPLLREFQASFASCCLHHRHFRPIILDT